MECPGQFCVHNQSFSSAGKWSGKGESISSALLCNSLCSQPGFIPVPHVLISVLGTEGTAQHGSVSQGDSHRSLQHSCTALSTLWDGVRGVCQPPALRSEFEDGIGIFVVCLSGVFSLCYQTPPKRRFLQSHLDLCDIHVAFINGYTPVVLGDSCPFHACCAPSFPCACCHSACEQDPAGWSPCGSCTLGKGGWDGSCTLNKRSLKATRYLHLPSGCVSSWRHSFGSVWKLPWICPLFRSLRSGRGVRVYPRVWE